MTSMRIWHQSMTELEMLPWYRSTLEDHAEKIIGDGVEVIVKGLHSGSYDGLSPSSVLGYAYPYHIVLSQVIEAAREAEKEGFDAFVVGSYSEPYLREIRSTVDIPVVSLAESTFLLGCSLAKYQGLISNTPAIARIVGSKVEQHRLQGRVIGPYSIDPPLDEGALAAASDDPSDFISNFVAAAERVIGEGADVVIPAEGVLSELLYSNKISRVGEVPVMDSLGVTWLHAEMMVNLWRRTGLRVGRRWEYARPSTELMERIRGAAGLES